LLIYYCLLLIEKQMRLLIYFDEELNHQSKATFISKISIVIEEADESEFWLEFIIDENLMPREKVLPLFSEAHELTSIFIATRRTAQRKNV
jgi:four helix bundle protein